MAAKTINSETLRKDFPEIYRDFFAKCQIVTSASTSFFWMGENVAQFGGPAIIQKLPQRVLVGLQFQEKPEIQIGGWGEFQADQEQFIQHEPSFDIISRLIQFFTQETLTKQLGCQSPGITIHILIETRARAGMNSSGATSAALAAALLLWAGELEPESLKRWPTYSRTLKLVQDSKSQFRKIFSLAWKIEAIFQSDSTSGATVAAALLDSSYPLFYFSEYRIGDPLDHGAARFPTNSHGDLSIYDRITFWVYRFDEFLPIKPLFNFPLDYCLINSGQRVNVASVKALIKAYASRARQISDFLKRILPEFWDPKSKLDEKLPRIMFARRLRDEGWPILHRWYIEGPQNALTLGTLRLFELFYTDSYTETAIEAFLQNINYCRIALSLTNLTSPQVLEFTQVIENQAQEFGYRNWGIKQIEIGSGSGNLLIAMPIGSLRGREESFITRLREKTGNPEVSLDYTSWLDGFGKEGLRIEQNALAGLRSAMLPEGGILLHSWHGKEHSSSVVITPQSIKDYLPRFDLFLDMTKPRFYLKGKGISSKDLPSTSTTAQLLRELLKRKDLVLNNKEMPPSSYATNRNDLQSKIVSPLNRLVQKKLKKELGLAIHGNSLDYSLVLGKSEINLGIAEKIH